MEGFTVVAEGHSLGALFLKLLGTADQPASSSTPPVRTPRLTPPVPVVVGSPVTPAAVDFSAMI